MKNWLSILLISCLIFVAWAKPKTQPTQGEQTKSEAVISDDFQFEMEGVMYIPWDVLAPAVKFIGRPPLKPLEGYLVIEEKPPANTFEPEKDTGMVVFS